MSCTGTATSNTITLPSYAPVNTVAPVISGTAVVGQTLTTTNGTWTNSPSSYSYQWKRGGVNISLATSSTYVLVAADAGINITCEVTATNSAGNTSATSNALAVYASILDQYSASAAAYSLRLLKGDRYNSALLRVRRSSDNAEVDVFVDSNYQLSLNSNITSRTSGTTLSSWVGSNNAFVVTWYDQTGNGLNTTQTTALRQPRIISTGVIDTAGSSPALLWTNGSEQRLINSSLNTAQAFTTFSVTKLSAATGINASVIYDSYNNTANTLYHGGNVESPANTLKIVSGVLLNVNTSTSNFQLITALNNSTSSVVRINSTQIVTGNVGTNGFSGISIGNLRGNPTPIATNYDFSGHITELIIFGANKTSEFTQIENNIITYYGIV